MMTPSELVLRAVKDKGSAGATEHQVAALTFLRLDRVRATLAWLRRSGTICRVERRYVAVPDSE